MSLLINGMKMPKGCVYRENGHLMTCPLYDSDGYCGALNTEASHKENEKPSCCPLIPIPPHGRLVDADEMFVEFLDEGQRSKRYKIGEKWELNGEEIRGVISRLPTIIPASEEKT